VHRIRASHGELGVETSAMAGLVAGFLGIVVIVIGWTYWFFAS
jgi:hypothetical protein